MIRLAVRCDPAQAELVLAELTVLSPAGVEEASGDGFVEYAIYGAEGELPDLGAIRAVSGEGIVEVDSSEIADDWADRWRSFHKPLTVGDRENGPAVWIRPPWERPHPDLPEVVVDPGQAFGTGAHPTTRLCIEALIDLATRGRVGPITDLGCGSGILAITAGKLGFGPLYGCDNDAAAVAVASENAAVNGVEARFERLDLKASLPALAPITLANLTAPVLESLAAGLTPENLPEILICSGLLTTEYDRVLAAFAPHWLAEQDRGAMSDWGSLVLERV